MKIRAVNLGGWFVLERWMKQSLFVETEKGCNDETCFSIATPHKSQVLEEHYKTWITKADIEWLKTQGVNLVRIPFPWWLFGDGVYHRSVEALDQALAMIEDVGLDFMLDLHTAPGCQNGFDNGGIQYVMDWHKDPKNIDRTIDVLVDVMKRYNHLQHFHSIQLLNEPNIDIPMDIIQDFYQRGYVQLRKIHPTRYIVMHDGFRLHQWESFFTTNPFTNVILDTHMYQCFDHRQFDYTIDQHCTVALKRQKTLADIEQFVPVIVGEWSLGLRMNGHIKQNDIDANLAKYASAQLQAMRHCTGHVFWSYKVSEDFSGWNFRKLVERNVIQMKEFIQ